jgi:MacB-like periplasmic core domain
MRTMRRFFKRLTALTIRQRCDERLEEEIEEHLALQTEENLRAGFTPADARRQAVLKFGAVQAVREEYREAGGLPFLEVLGQDVAFGSRVLRKNPGFALVVVFTLALGIGANTALFSIVDGVLLNPLPYPQPGELVTVHASKANFDTGSISWPNFRDWQRDNRTLASLAVSRQRGFSLTGKGNAERLHGDYVSADFFSILAIKPVLVYCLT